jgi:hypothetical protein
MGAPAMLFVARRSMEHIAAPHSLRATEPRRCLSPGSGAPSERCAMKAQMRTAIGSAQAGHSTT